MSSSTAHPSTRRVPCGWKFRAVGQGYVDGLVGLATDHGVDVAEDGAGDEAGHVAEGGAGSPAPAPAVAAPAVPVPTVPLSSPAPAPAAPVPTVAVSSPAPAPPATVPSPAPVPTVAAQPVAWGAAHPADWSFGAVFEPYTQTGRDNDVITVDGLPPGPVIVDLAVEDEGYTGLWPLDGRNKKKDSLVNSTEPNFRGRLLTEVPGRGPLRLRLQAENRWRIQVLPLAAGRRLTEEWLECGGPDVLLHTAGTADLAIRYRGDDNLIVDLYELAGHQDVPAPGKAPEVRKVRDWLRRGR
ncbi:hypothetical protein [Streptomyces sparsogenes]|uniref:hypothetical protein n=1 Tax=Streptomyces sparsogenes TaxID=67365 RepID=UPI0033CD76EC